MVAQRIIQVLIARVMACAMNQTERVTATTNTMVLHVKHRDVRMIAQEHWVEVTAMTEGTYFINSMNNKNLIYCVEMMSFFDVFMGFIEFVVHLIA